MIAVSWAMPVVLTQYDSVMATVMGDS
ncbi:hypothetical protein VS_0151 [Vibrio atlanticus]|uniref:Uncharacterized protein n=1 Tax=Vibrio atlanticus (strain LGP32) TaxID=575788 RepID=B7VHH2_VIBA3|nr:hypothetical protein VS_0151 [Vibrio atlanticus]